VIETGEYEPVGSHETARCDARVIVASNWDLEEAIFEGRFRQDLFYRLNVFPFHLPPLRERRCDIASLARGLAAHFSTRFGKGLTDITPEAIAVLDAFDWPGNIRQLENIVQQAVLVSDGGPDLTVQDLPEAVRRPVDEKLPSPIIVPAATFSDGRPTAPAGDSGLGRSSSLLQSRAEYERGLIEQTLADCKFNRSATARALGISRVTLHKKIKQYGLTNVPVGSRH